MRQLLSKLIAGGLSAGSILLWWPTVFHSDSLTSWTLRGVVWTLMFEMLLLTLGPLEAAIWDNTRPGRKLVRGVQGAKARLVAQPSVRRRNSSLAVVAIVALSVPLGLIVENSGRHVKPVRAEAAPVKVVQITRVVKVVRSGVTRTVYLPAATRPLPRQRRRSAGTMLRPVATPRSQTKAGATTPPTTTTGTSTPTTQPAPTPTATGTTDPTPVS